MKKVIITGCADGIGFETAKLFLKRRYAVFGFDTKPIKEEIDINFQVVNINDMTALKQYIEQLPNFDVVINNAAIQFEKPFIEQTFEDIDLVINTNLASVIKFTQLMIKKLKTGSLIINLGSVHATHPRLNKLPYDVSKAGLDMFTKSLALEIAPNIRVIGLNIGATKTPMNQVFEDKKVIESALKKIPLNHIFTSNEIAKVIYRLTQPAFKFMTGSIVVFDGGRSLV